MFGFYADTPSKSPMIYFIHQPNYLHFLVKPPNLLRAGEIITSRAAPKAVKFAFRSLPGNKNLDYNHLLKIWSESRYNVTNVMSRSKCTSLATFL